MKKNLLLASIMAFGISSYTYASDDSDTEKNPASRIVVGAGVGQMSAVEPGGVSIAPTISYFYTLGYNFDDMWAIEYTYTIAVDDPKFSVYGVDGRYNLETDSLYGVFRTPGDVFFKAKIGATYKDVSANIAGVGLTDYGTDPSVGVGVGVRGADGHGLFEAEYFYMKSDVLGAKDISGFSVGLKLAF